MTIISISPTIQRRFILGRQGLWPGRRWSGKEGTAQALHQVEAIQIDPVFFTVQPAGNAMLRRGFHVLVDQLVCWIE